MIISASLKYYFEETWWLNFEIKWTDLRYKFLISWVIFQDRISVLLSDCVIVACHISFPIFYICVFVHKNYSFAGLASPLHCSKSWRHRWSCLCSCVSLWHGLQWSGGELFFFLFLFFLFSGISKPETSTFILSLLLINCVLFLFPMVPSDWWGEFENI